MTEENKRKCRAEIEKGGWLKLGIIEPNGKFMPPADVQKVRHGKWENVGDNLIMEQTTIVGKCVKCSECGNENLVARTDNGSYRFSNYCANCGAKMDKE